MRIKWFTIHTVYVFFIAWLVECLSIMVPKVYTGTCKTKRFWKYPYDNTVFENLITLKCQIFLLFISTRNFNFHCSVMCNAAAWAVCFTGVCLAPRRCTRSVNYARVLSVTSRYDTYHYMIMQYIMYHDMLSTINKLVIYVDYLCKK